ncbi:MAG: polymorphic toxin type 15 domain-containing protein [Cellulosilyticaceae bacterium]
MLLDSEPGGFVWLHEPDMRTGGLPTDITRIGIRRINSILGGQANRIVKDILNMSDEVTKIHWTIEIK